MNLTDALSLGRLDAHDQASRVRSGDLTALELVEAAILRAGHLDPALQAISHRADALARERAAAQDAQGAGRGLAGVPYLVKDSLAYPGMPTRGGSRSRSDALATQAPPLSQRFDAAGLVPIGKSAMPEFGLMPSNEPLRGPVTRNPWSLAHSPGGSSGGAGAAIAAGIVPLAQGSDGAGSIRMPAACCGIVGLKPGRGAVVQARARHALEDLLVSDGLMARSVRDCAWAFAATHPASPPIVTGASARRLRIAVDTRNLAGDAAHPDVAQAVESAAALCAGLGHHVDIVASPVSGQDARDALLTLWSRLCVDAVELNTAAGLADDLLEPWTRGLAQWHLDHVDIAALEHAYRQLARLPDDFADFHAQWDVLLTPVVRTPPPLLGVLAPDRAFDALMPALFDWMSYTPLQNLAGTPAISLPLSWNADGLPVGVQFAADRGQEAALLSLAFELEAAQPWRDRWPDVAVAAR
ncbi:amidase family protein [Luteimonas sp. RIT-PG2_3]